VPGRVGSQVPKVEVAPSEPRVQRGRVNTAEHEGKSCHGPYMTGSRKHRRVKPLAIVRG
jgi:hypothetical protein